MSVSKKYHSTLSFGDSLLQDGLRLSIKFTNQPEYELDADTQEDKNKVNDAPKFINSGSFNASEI